MSLTKPDDSYINLQPKGNFPRLVTRSLLHVSGELKGVEIKENEFARFELWIDGKGIANSSNPEDLWPVYREYLIRGLSEGVDRIVGHSFGITAHNEAIELPHPEGFEDEKREIQERFFSTFKLG